MADGLYDCLIVGGGPAGSSAALVLGRSRRRVLLIDAGRPRNARETEMRGFIGQEGRAPQAFRSDVARELEAYPGIERRFGEATDAAIENGVFRLGFGQGEEARGRRLILATGVTHEFPAISGFEALFGERIWTCPYCHGWEHRDEPLAVLAQGPGAAGFAVEIAQWTRDVVLFTNGGPTLPEDDRVRLAGAAIRSEERPLRAIEPVGGATAVRIVFTDGDAIVRSGLFVRLPGVQASPLVERLGCDLTARGTAATGPYERTNVPGLYVAGDASRRVQFAIVAAAEGAMAAFAVNAELAEENEARRAAPV